MLFTLFVGQLSTWIEGKSKLMELKKLLVLDYKGYSQNSFSHSASPSTLGPKSVSRKMSAFWAGLKVSSFKKKKKNDHWLYNYETSIQIKSQLFVSLLTSLGFKLIHVV